MNKVMYADGDTPQSFESPPPTALQKLKEEQLRSNFQSQKKARPIEHTRIWVLYDEVNSQVKK